MFAGTLFRGSALEDLWRLRSEIEDLFGEPAPGPIRALPRSSFPALNVGLSPQKADVYLFAPGLDSKSLQISLEQNLLTIRGERRVPPAEGATQYRKERFDGAFQRSVTLPEDVDPEKVEARYRDGVVHISIQRREAEKPRQITIQAD
jgi:HSP20 family protein